MKKFSSTFKNNQDIVVPAKTETKHVQTTAETQAFGDSSSKIATTAFVQENEASAVISSASVETAGALMDAEVTNLSEVKSFDPANYATASQGSKVDFISVTQDVNLDQIETDIAALANGMVYKGDWDASSGTFPGIGAAQVGWLYYVNVAGTVDGIAFAVGDNIIATVDNSSASVYASNWSKHDQTDAVQAVVGLIGSVTKTALLSALNVEDGSNATNAANVEASGALMDSELASIANVKALNQSLVSGASPNFTIANQTVDNTELVVANSTNLQTNLEKLDAAVLRARGTGVSSDYTFTVAAGSTVFNVSAVSGEINSSSLYADGTYAGDTGVTVANLNAPSTYVYLDSSFTLQQQTTTPTEFEWDNKIFLARIAVDTDTNLILGKEFLCNPVGHYGNTVRTLWRYLVASGVPFKIGLEVTGHPTDMGFDTAAGTLMEYGGTGQIHAAHELEFFSVTGVSFTLTERTSFGLTVTDLPKVWDNAGVLTALGSTTCVAHRLYMYSNGNKAVAYGQGNYANMVLCKVGSKLEEFVLNPALKNAQFLGWWLIEETATGTSGTVDAEFVEYVIGIQGGSSSGLAGAALLSNNGSDYPDAEAFRTNVGINAALDKRYAPSFATIAAMTNATPLAIDGLAVVFTVGMLVCVVDYATGNNSGVMFGSIVAGGTGTADGGSYINLANGMQWKQNFSGNGINVKHFGAVGDGVTDARTAFAAALLLASDFNGSTGSVFIPAGHYLINTDGGSLTIAESVELFGESGNQIRRPSAAIQGSLLNIAGVTNSPFIFFRGCVIRGFSVDYPDQDEDPVTPATYPALFQGDPSNFGGKSFFRDLMIDRCYNGFYMTGATMMHNVNGCFYKKFVEITSSSAFNHISNSSSSALWHNGSNTNTLAYQQDNLVLFKVSGGSDGLTIDSCTFFIAKVGFFFTDADNINFLRSSNTLFDGVMDPIVTDGTVQIKAIQFSNCFFGLFNHNGSTFRGSTMIFNGVSSATYLDQVVSFDGCRFRGAQGGIFTITSGVDQFILNGCTFTDWNRSQASGKDSSSIVYCNSSIVDVTINGAVANNTAQFDDSIDVRLMTIDAVNNVSIVGGNFKKVTKLVNVTAGVTIPRLTMTDTTGEDVPLPIVFGAGATITRQINANNNLLSTDNVTSAAAMTLPSVGHFFKITGTTNITSITASWIGREVLLTFGLALTVTDGSNLKLAGNFTTNGEDTMSLVCDGTDWFEISRSSN